MALWADICDDFGSGALNEMQPFQLTKLRNILMQNGVHVETTREKSRLKHLIECLEK
jgi:hypothetical protein